MYVGISKTDIEIRTKPNGKSSRSISPKRNGKDMNSTSKKSRFIVLGSSGEVLPVTRKSLAQMSVYSSCNSQSTESFHSAKDTIEEEPGNYINLGRISLIEKTFQIFQKTKSKN